MRCAASIPIRAKRVLAGEIAQNKAAGFSSGAGGIRCGCRRRPREKAPGCRFSRSSSPGCSNPPPSWRKDWTRLSRMEARSRPLRNPRSGLSRAQLPLRFRRTLLPQPTLFRPQKRPRRRVLRRIRPPRHSRFPRRTRLPSKGRQRPDPRPNRRVRPSHHPRLDQKTRPFQARHRSRPPKTAARRHSLRYVTKHRSGVHQSNLRLSNLFRRRRRWPPIRCRCNRRRLASPD